MTRKKYKYSFTVRGDFYAYDTYAYSKQEAKEYCYWLFGVYPKEIWSDQKNRERKELNN
jgi:hypothetical protein